MGGSTFSLLRRLLEDISNTIPLVITKHGSIIDSGRGGQTELDEGGHETDDTLTERTQHMEHSRLRG